MSLKAKKIVIVGRIQGVGFRATCRKLAMSLGLRGYAKNLMEGSVEILLVGELENIDSFKKSILDQFGKFYIREFHEIELTDYPHQAGFSVL